jgi:hypothetical protein
MKMLAPKMGVKGWPFYPQGQKEGEGKLEKKWEKENPQAGSPFCLIWFDPLIQTFSLDPRWRQGSSGLFLLLPFPYKS